MEQLLKVENLRVSYHSYAGEVQSVRGVSFEVNKGETVAVVGESGCGKSVTSKAIIYHGSFLEIARPDLVHSRPNVDFGRGFYVTPLYEQAVKWCGKFKHRGKNGVISRKRFNRL